MEGLYCVKSCSCHFVTVFCTVQDANRLGEVTLIADAQLVQFCKHFILRPVGLASHLLLLTGLYSANLNHNSKEVETDLDCEDKCRRLNC